MKKRGSMLFLLVVFAVVAPLGLDDQSRVAEWEANNATPSEAMKALDFWSAQRAYPNRVIPEDAFYKAFEDNRFRMRTSGKVLNTTESWTSIGPTNRGGRTNALVVDPRHPDVIYAGAASGGLWRLTLNEDSYSWEYIDTGFPVLGVNAIAIDPTNSDVVYIGTGEVYGYQSSIGGLHIRTTRGSYGIGLLKTTDRGATWQKSIDWAYNQERGLLVIRINPLNPDVLFAGTTEGTYKSVDAGGTWQKVDSTLMVVDIAINPVDTSIVYISCGNLGSPGAGIYRSMEGGKPGSWTKLSSGLPSSWSGKTLLALYQSSPNIVYADVADAFRTVGLYRSTDNGEHWMLLTSGNNVDYASYQGWFSHYVRVHPEDSSRIFCAGVQFYISNDGGSSLVQEYGMHVDHHAYAEHPTDPDVVYFANDGGVYRTLDGGATFQELNGGYVTTQFYNGFSSSVQNPELALGGLQDNNTVMYTGSEEWIRDLIGGDGAFTAISTHNDDTMYGSSQYLNIHCSTDGGQFWTDISDSFNGQAVCFIAPYVLSPSHPWILYAGEDVIHKSENMGEDWAVMNNGFPLSGNAVLSLAVSHTDPDVVYATTVPTTNRRGEVFSSTDGGFTWQNITGDLPDRYYVDLQVSLHDDGVAYITLSGFGSSHLYRTENGGQNWSDIGGGLPDVPTSAVIVDHENPSHIYVGNDLGVFVTTDNGSTWQEFREDLPTAVLVMDLSVSPSNRKLRAVTHGNGVYERSLISSTPVPVNGQDASIASYELYQNYPNPFNPSTEIAFAIPKSSYVTLKIYNISGQEIRTLVTNGYTAGKFKVSWDGKDNSGRNAAGGTYIYRLEADNFVEVKKMALVR